MQRYPRSTRLGMLRRNLQLMMLAWTVVVAISLGWNLYSQRESFEASLRGQAESMHAVEMQYRNWIIANGGVYVPVSDKVQPNPRLAHIPERDISTPGGQQLTLLNSSYVVRLVHEGEQVGGMRGHIASLHPINPINAPDVWERSALQAFQQGAREWASFDTMDDGKRYFRYMQPMVADASCMKCHAVYGDRVGDIRGGVSIAIPVARQALAQSHERNVLLVGHGLVWGVGLFGLFLAGRRQQADMERIGKTEAEAALLANSIAHAIFGQDVEGNCTFINAAGVKALGYDDAEELLGKNMHQLTHHSYADGSVYHYRDCPNYAAIHSRAVRYSEQEVLWRKDGSSFPAEYWSYPVIQDGKVHGAVVTFLDISGQLQVRNDLKRSQALLQSVVENMPAMVFLKDARDLRFQLFNRAGEQMLGYTRAQMLGKNDYDFFPREQADFFTQKDRIVLAGRQLLEIPAESINTASGEQRWLHTFKTGLYDDAGQPTYLLGISMDVTENKRMEEALRASEAKLSEAQHMAHIGHWELDIASQRLQWSDEVYSIFEIEPDAFDGTYQAFLAAIHPQDRAAVDRAYQEALRNRSSYQMHHRLLMKDGRVKYVLERCETSYAADGKPLRSLGMVQDVTASMFAEQALREQQQVLDQALEGTVHTVSLAVEMRDPYTAGHQQRVALLSCIIAQRLGWDDDRIKGLRLGASIHDIGKIGIPAEVLSKPSRLNEIETRIVQEHARMGYDILKDVRFPWPIADIARQHHERMDGSGYPQGLQGEAICMEARIVAVADVVESMATHRPYRPALGLAAAREEIAAGSGSRYDAQVAAACIAALDEGFTFS